MNAETLRDFTLKAREILIGEVEDQLEGIYGLLASGTFEPTAGYPALAQIPECAETRSRLETFLADEQAAGLDPKAARRKLAKEAAFTWLNRLVALKMMETRKLVRQTVSKGADSNGFKMWLTEGGNEPHLADYEAGEMPKDARGEGPRDRAYRRFLLAQCGRLAEEIRVLFDPDNLVSRLAPRPTVLAHLIDMTSDSDVAEAWQPGNEETIGWVYQGFNSEELEAAFREARVAKKKFQAEDIPAVTQLFTPRWIVRYLVENTLGRTWLQMHPDSELLDKLDYLVPLEGEVPPAPLKPVREITLLDPACGTMHFGLVAFDLFVEMYHEELNRAGEEGWLAEPSVGSEEEIAASIVANNIHGIDIDLRAVQLSAMTLYLRAKTLNPKARLTENRLACADIHMLDGERLQAFLDEAGLQQPIYRRILTALQSRLEDAEQLGSLLRLDEEIRSLVEQERHRYEREGRQMDFIGWSSEQFGTEAGIAEFWDTLEIQIGQALDAFGKQKAEQGLDPSLFLGETAKGLRLMEIMSRRYDAVVTNPPYMSARKMNQRLKKLVADGFPEGKRDLYAAFTRRCIEFGAQQGRVGMLTMHSFMFISSYEGQRTWIRDRVAIETLAHAGPALFDVGNPGTLQTVAHIVRCEDGEQVRSEAVGTYFRLVKEPDAEAKRTRFEQAVARLQSAQPAPLVYHYRQADFDSIPGSPWVYWITAGVRNLFSTLPKLGEIAQPRVGLQTSDNFRFLRCWWEIGVGRIGLGCASSREAQNTGRRWFPYMKGGSFLRWFGNQRYTVNWGDDGAEVKCLGIESGKIASRPQNAEYYFRCGVTYPMVTSKTFSARYMPQGFVFGHAGNSFFLDSDAQLLEILGLLNSSFFAALLVLLNPTINVLVDDLMRLPYTRMTRDTVQDLVTKAVDCARGDGREDETTLDFVSPALWPNGEAVVSSRRKELREIESQIDEEIFRLYGISGADRVAIESETSMGITDGEDQVNNHDELDAETTQPALSRKDLAWRWLSYAVGIVIARFQPGDEGALGCGEFSDEAAGRLCGLADEDGILVQDEGHPDDLAARTLDALCVMLGDEEAREVVLTATGKTGETEAMLRKYLEGRFFKEHIKLYRKRPVYWLLQSPKKKYGIWIFHERLTADSLYRIQREYIDPKIKLLDGQLAELRKKRDATDGRERRKTDKEMAAVEDVLADIREFAARMDRIIQRGYTPHVDDGVLLNMAPLWELIPSWQAEPKKAWKALERGDYDWAHHAMDYWPERVKEKCKENKSFAIAHGLA